MRKITETYLEVGLEAPVKILQITDNHITIANEQDTMEHKALMERRTQSFKEEGDFPPKTPVEYFKEAINHSKEMNALLVNTGDTIDIHTKGNVEEFQKISKGLECMFTPGGHEHQRVCVRTMEEPYPYFETVRPQLQKEFPYYDLDFSSRVINGLNIICADNSLDYYSPKTLERFKAELQKGLPIIVFSHNPIWDEMLKHKEPYHENVRLTDDDYKASHEMQRLLKTHPLVITTFSGHHHIDEEMTIEGKTHYATAALFKGCCRYIEIR